MPGTPDLGQPATPPAPTLDDVMALKADSSYAPFVARDVAPEVRNAAMKKLFADPHYKLMDGLDIYVGDYSLPDPLPPSMLRQLASAKFMNLFDDDPKPPTGEAGLSDQPIAMPPAPDTLATPAAPESTAENPAHDHTDLRLQPDHAPGPAEPERVLK